MFKFRRKTVDSFRFHYKIKNNVSRLLNFSSLVNVSISLKFVTI